MHAVAVVFHIHWLLLGADHLLRDADLRHAEQRHHLYRVRPGIRGCFLVYQAARGRSWAILAIIVFAAADTGTYGLSYILHDDSWPVQTLTAAPPCARGDCRSVDRSEKRSSQTTSGRCQVCRSWADTSASSRSDIADLGERAPVARRLRELSQRMAALIDDKSAKVLRADGDFLGCVAPGRAAPSGPHIRPGQPAVGEEAFGHGRCTNGRLAGPVFSSVRRGRRADDALGLAWRAR